MKLRVKIRRKLQGKIRGKIVWKRRRKRSTKECKTYLQVPNPPGHLFALVVPERDRLRSRVLLAGHPKNTPWLYDNVSHATRIEWRMSGVEDVRLGTAGCTTDSFDLRLVNSPV